MSFHITALYAGIFALMAVALSMMVSIARRRSDISILDGDNPTLAERMRRHGNFIETVPLVLILMGLMEVQAVSVFWLHLMGLSLLVFRVAHVFGVHADRTIAMPRFVGAMGTHLITLGAGLYLIWGYFF